MNTRDYEPIGPETPRFKELRLSFRAQNPLFQGLLIGYLLISAVGTTYGSVLISREFCGWISWSISLLFLEPIGATSILALLFLICPGVEWVEGFLGFAFPKARAVVISVGLLVLGGVLFAFGYITFELWELYFG